MLKKFGFIKFKHFNNESRILSTIYISAQALIILQVRARVTLVKGIPSAAEVWKQQGQGRSVSRACFYSNKALLRKTGSGFAAVYQSVQMII